jgi:hypothetical protein
MGAFGDDARRYASGANWLRLGNGDVVEVQILEIHKVRDKEWDSDEAEGGRRVDKVIDVDVYVYSATKPGKPTEAINEPRAWDPKCAWISDLIDLSDALDKASGKVGTIKTHKIRLIRADKPGPKGYRYGWIEVVDLGPCAVPQAGQAPQQAATTPPLSQQVQQPSAYQQPQPAGPQAFAARIAAAPNAQAVTLIWQEANAVGLGRDPSVLQAASARKEALILADINAAPDPQALSFMAQRVEAECKGDMLVRMRNALAARQAALAGTGDDEIPF